MDQECQGKIELKFLLKKKSNLRIKKISRAKVNEARHLMREINHVKQRETWIDGPNSPIKTLATAAIPGAGQNSNGAYGFMDNHKKSMIRQWVENQTTQILNTQDSTSNTPQQQQSSPQTQQQQRSTQQSEDEILTIEITHEVNKIIDPISKGLNVLHGGPNSSESNIRTGLKQNNPEISDVVSERSGISVSASQYGNNQPAGSQDEEEEEDQDSGPSEVPPALPLITPLSSREISHESNLHLICSRHMSRESLGISQQHVQMMDCGLQVTEEEIARTMGW